MREASTRATRFRRLTCAVAGLVIMLLALNACQAPDPFAASGHVSGMSTAVRASTTPTGWTTYTDRGNDGFTISYPVSWQATRTGLNDAIFIDKTTDTTLDVTVTTVPLSPAAALAQQQPTSAEMVQRNITVTPRTIANHPAVDIFTPYYRVPTPVVQMPNSGAPGIAGGRRIVMAATNSAGTTNVYTFVVNYNLDSSVNIVPASQADNPVLLEMVDTFQLPATIDPVLTHP